MHSILLLGFSSFALSLFLTPFVRNQAVRLGLVDRPDNHRKIHKLPIPRLGGIAILASIAGAYALVLLAGLSSGHIVRDGLPFAVRFLPAVLVIFGTGLIDDIFDVKPWYKLTAQIVAAVLAWNSGIRLYAIDGHSFSATGSFLLTLAWIVAYSNAVNLIDGVDGLAAGAALLAATTTLIAGLLHGNIELVFATVPLVGALLGFLRFNFNPASIFLGDSGSLTLGFLLGCYGIVCSEKSTTLLGMTAPLLALSVPLFDAGVSIVRRFLRQQPIFQGDREHIHHKLLSQGLTPRRVVLILYAFCGMAGVASLLMTQANQKYQGSIIVLVCFTAWLGLQHLGYEEFDVAGKMALRGGFRRRLNTQRMLAEFEQELAGAATLEQCWKVLCRAYPQFGFCGIELHLDNVLRHGNVSGIWHVQVDLSGDSYLRLLRRPGVKERGAAALLFLDRIAPLLQSKLDELRQNEVEFPAFANAD